jgi:murein L,D-transpeptidase YcbB/YkuD
VAQGKGTLGAGARRTRESETERREREPLEQPAALRARCFPAMTRIQHDLPALLRSGVTRMLTRGALGLAIIFASGVAGGANGAPDALRARLEQLRAGAEVRVLGERIAAQRLIPQFYQRRDLRPAWTDPERARALLALVESSATHGLDPNDYHVAALRALLKAPADTTSADRDLLFTDAIVRLAYHLRFGKANPRELFPRWNFTRSLGPADPVVTLEALVAAPRLDQAAERFAPRLPAYRSLRTALARLRAIDARGGWPRVPPGPSLKPGLSQARVAALRARLEASDGDLAASPAAEAVRFDDALEAAVRRFQERHGIAADGVVGPRTLQALNVSAAARVEQVRVNLERLRWVAQDLAGDYLIVDIAGFTARLYLDNRLAWSSRTVVGRPYRRTPVFRATMRYLVLNPTWTVPPTVLRKDVLPKARRDPGYLARNHMRIVDAGGRGVDPAAVDWERLGAGRFPYQIVQAPGEDNALGKIKFMLPNPQAVYLHDTPSRQLFLRTERAFSSGCIRLERPLELAVLLLDDPRRWSADALRAAIASGETRVVPVKRQVPVMVLYFTAQTDEDGSVRFQPDLYRRDARVAEALAAPFRFAPVDHGRGR